MNKICSKCKKSKKYSSFYKDKRTSDGFYNHCKSCHSSYVKNWQEENKKRFKQSKKEWRKNNPNYFKKYYNDNKEYLIKKSCEYVKHRLKVDPEYRLVHNLRRRVHHVISSNYKSQHTMDLLGCSVEVFLDHLESLFDIGMSWDNYGEWHVDHIKPCASFDLTKESEQKKCFNYTNLQPLWAEDNLKKGKKYKNDLKL